MPLMELVGRLRLRGFTIHRETSGYSSEKSPDERLQPTTTNKLTTPPSYGASVSHLSRLEFPYPFGLDGPRFTTPAMSRRQSGVFGRWCVPATLVPELSVGYSRRLPSPNWSREQNNSFFALSQMANAHIPTKRVTQLAPHSR